MLFKQLSKTIRRRRELKTAYLTNRQSKADIHYLVSGANWSVKHDGECLMSLLPNVTGNITHSEKGLQSGLLHFGGIADAIMNKQIRWPEKPLICGLTWFHIVENDKRLRFISEFDHRLAFWHSSCQSTIDTLIQHGADAKKCHVIPLGVDVNIFKPQEPNERAKLKKTLNIPENTWVIGSFQKDGIGWKDGLTPKLDKGPDLFCEALEILAKEHPVFALLTGPARGYVKKRLQKAGIPFLHLGYLDHANDVAQYFQALDLYLISSRIEGGPKSALEAPASGIPLVTTPVGMVADILVHDQSAMITEQFDATELATHCKTVLLNPDLKQRLIENGRKTAERHSWELISQRYYNELYKPNLCQPHP